jgi:Trk-type K+ transport system membrane component
MATAGPGLGALTPDGGAIPFDGPGRGVLMVLMLAGRLEVYPVVLAVTGAVGAGLDASRRVLAGRR